MRRYLVSLFAISAFAVVFAACCCDSGQDPSLPPDCAKCGAAGSEWLSCGVDGQGVCLDGGCWYACPKAPDSCELVRATEDACASPCAPSSAPCPAPQGPGVVPDSPSSPPAAVPSGYWTI